MITQGNRNLAPEAADTLGVGAVVKPRLLPGFSASVDYWDINLNDAIEVLSAANVLNLCLAGVRPELCANIGRDNAGVLQGVTVTSVNLSSRNIRGLDYEASYRTDLGFAPGSVGIHVNATNYLEDRAESPVIETLDSVGTITGVTKWRYTGTLAYSLKPFVTSLTVRGHSGGKINATYIECQSACPASPASHPTVNLNHAPSIFYLDWAANFDFNFGTRLTTAFVNIRNLQNKPHPDNFAVTANFNNANVSTAYDVDGRTFRIGMRFSL